LALGLAAVIFIFGYGCWIIPMQQRLRRWEKIGLQQSSLPARLDSRVSTAVFDEQVELQRWASDSGGLLSWKRKGSVIHFEWLGAYAPMLKILRQWPSELPIKRMHWQRGKQGGVQWSGEYALVR
jgi:hypothetical protein